MGHGDEMDTCPGSTVVSPGIDDHYSTVDPPVEIGDAEPPAPVVCLSPMSPCPDGISCRHYDEMDTCPGSTVVPPETIGGVETLAPVVCVSPMSPCPDGVSCRHYDEMTRVLETWWSRQ